jgi:hypothetical protein
MDSAAANRAAMDLLDEQRQELQLPAVVKLQCCPHTLYLLLKDLYKRFEWVRNVFDAAMFISAAINSNESLRYLFKQQVLASNSTATTLATHSETRFGSQHLVLKSCLKQIVNLVAMVDAQKFLKLVQERNATAIQLHHLLSVKYADDVGFVSRAPILVELCEPLYDAMIQVEADKAFSSRTLALVKKIEAHAKSFSAKHANLANGWIVKKGQPDKHASLTEVFDHRLREFYYKPAFAAAYLLDPVHFLLSKTGVYELPFDKMSVSEQNDAMSDIERLGGADAVADLAEAQLNGSQGLNHLHKKTLQTCVSITEQVQAGGSVKSLTVPVHKRRQLWEKVC